MSDLLPAILCQLIYTKTSYFDRIFDNGSVYAGYKLLNEEHILVCRGSVTAINWWDDVESIDTYNHPVLGTVGKGFIVGIDDIYPDIKNFIPDKIIKIYGHSLGCSHAFYLAGLFIKDGYKVEIVALEPPRSCGDTLIGILAPYPVRCYRNNDDAVTYVPLSLEHPRELIQLNCPAVAGDITIFKNHHVPLLITAFAMLEQGV